MIVRERKVITVTAEPGESLSSFWKELGEIEGGGWTVEGTLTIRQGVE